MFSLENMWRSFSLYTCAYRNFAKILGNKNVYPNIIGVKLNNFMLKPQFDKYANA